MLLFDTSSGSGLLSVLLLGERWAEELLLLMLVEGRGGLVKVGGSSCGGLQGCPPGLSRVLFGPLMGDELDPGPLPGLM